MNNDRNYSFRMERTSYKSQNLIYEELGFKLVIYLESSAIPQYDWLGCDLDFQKWSEPQGEIISEQKRQEILSRLSAWSAEQAGRH